MHIRFFDHGKGSAAHASSYVLDELDHKGHVRAGIDVLRGDATTFNSICNSSPYLWKYTSGVIAWSKDDAPNQEQIQEVLTEFETHAFAGLDHSQYHLFAVQHTDDDGSKHIHILVPRLDLESGKHLNIAPPGHESYFDPLRDYFNTKYQWSRPDDLSWSNTTQEPNHVAKINKNAEKIIPEQDLEKMKKKQFCRFVDMHLRKMLKAGEIENRADIVAEIECFKGVQSIKPSKEFLTVTLDNGIKHRLRGDFYFENFEIGAYTERIREAAASRATPDELRSAIREADDLVTASRAKRATYNQKHYPLTQGRDYDNSHRIEPELNFGRDKKPIPPSPENGNRGVSRSVKGNPRADIEYRYLEPQNAFSFNPIPADRNRQKNQQHFNRSEEHTSSDTSPSAASDSEPKRTDRDRNSVATKLSKSKTHDMGEYSSWTVDSFNQFLYQLSVQYKPKDDQSTKRNDPTKCKNNNQPTELPEQPAGEISHADRNRPVFSRAKRLVSGAKCLISRAKQLIESTGQFIKDHLGHIQASRAGIEGPNPDTASLDHRAEKANFRSATNRILGSLENNLSNQIGDSVSRATDRSIDQSGFRSRCQQLSESRTEATSNETQQSTGGDQEITLEDRADACAARLLQRLGDAEQADQDAWRNSGKIDSIAQELDRVAENLAKLRIKPKLATAFGSLRMDSYYLDYVTSYKELSAQQEQSYQSKNVLLLIKSIEQKSEKLAEYMSRARTMLGTADYQKIEEIIKNDERMLNYLKCEQVLDPKNGYRKEQRDSYLSCLNNFEEIRSSIQEITSPSPQNDHNKGEERRYEPELKPTTKPKNDFGFYIE